MYYYRTSEESEILLDIVLDLLFNYPLQSVLSVGITDGLSVMNWIIEFNAVMILFSYNYRTSSGVKFRKNLAFQVSSLTRVQ